MSREQGTERANGVVRLRPRFFRSSKLRVNRHRFSQQEQISYPTLLRYLDSDGQEPIENFSGTVLYSLLVRGFGMSPADVEALRIGDVFEVVPQDE